MFSKMLVVAVGVAALFASHANATIVGFSNCTGANACTVTATPPNPVVKDPNDGILLVWNEVQNYTLTSDLRVDRVFDPNASFITDLGNGDYLIHAGTVVSSHYVQWDPGNGSSNTVNATIQADSQIFAFITADNNLSASDPILGLPGLNYNTFNNRGLESNDVTNFSGADVAISWRATSPGDWSRLVTAYSPAAVPVPASVLLLAGAVSALGIAGYRRRKV